MKKLNHEQQRIVYIFMKREVRNSINRLILAIKKTANEPADKKDHKFNPEFTIGELRVFWAEELERLMHFAK